MQVNELIEVKTFSRIHITLLALQQNGGKEETMKLVLRWKQRQPLELLQLIENN